MHALMHSSPRNLGLATYFCLLRVRSRSAAHVMSVRVKPGALIAYDTLNVVYGATLSGKQPILHYFCSLKVAIAEQHCIPH
ncbi:hypothetical protein BDB00DRAFT_429358 [Zychaea mexicana]|uniref:uncharacterized protein n=1 Tax=Zychaea mexicana TaxID=64656 RepID=UPI0022FEDACE|nr:uncharacterized protein BDB00DRAFT_429358 [Zychaea mexicana]KAI9492533.1 hypothetical protein BDB00DRAFT_429358 [Zychaea mexicana]